MTWESVIQYEFIKLEDVASVLENSEKGRMAVEVEGYLRDFTPSKSQILGMNYNGGLTNGRDEITLYLWNSERENQRNQKIISTLTTALNSRELVRIRGHLYQRADEPGIYIDDVLCEIGE